MIGEPMAESKLHRCNFLCTLFLKGIAWSDIYAGRYYPTLSLYKGATVSLDSKVESILKFLQHLTSRL